MSDWHMYALAALRTGREEELHVGYRSRSRSGRTSRVLDEPERRPAGIRPAVVPAPHRADGGGGRLGRARCSRACGSSASSSGAAPRTSSARSRATNSRSSTTSRRTRSSSRPSTASRTPANCSAARTRGPARKPATSSQMVNAVNSAISRQSRRHRRVADRPDGVQRARQERALRGDPGRLLQRRRRTAQERTPGLHRPEPRSVGRKDGRTHRRTRPVGGSGAVHRDAGLAEHPAEARRRAEVPENQVRDHDPHGRDGRRGPAGAHGHRIVSGGSSRNEGHVRRRRRLDRRRREDDPEERRQGQGQGRRL